MDGRNVNQGADDRPYHDDYYDQADQKVPRSGLPWSDESLIRMNSVEMTLQRLQRIKFLSALLTFWQWNLGTFEGCIAKDGT